MLNTTGYPGAIIWIVLVLVSGGIFTTIHYAVSYFPKLLKEYCAIKKEDKPWKNT